jgi:hypothetical protein
MPVALELLSNIAHTPNMHPGIETCFWLGKRKKNTAKDYQLTSIGGIRTVRRAPCAPYAAAIRGLDYFRVSVWW